VCFGVLLVTGSFNLWMRGIRLADFARREFWASPFGRALLLKLGVFAFVLAISAVHDFVVGPRATAAIQRDPRSRDTERLRRQASWLGRANAVLALVLVAIGVILVRGWPW
jgi:putative copper export protein